MMQSLTPIQIYQQAVQTLKSAQSMQGMQSADAVSQIGRSWLKTVAQSEQQAKTLAHQFAMGNEQINLHQVMIESQKSLVYLKATAEITKRCLMAYQEIWNMHLG